MAWLWSFWLVLEISFAPFAFAQGVRFEKKKMNLGPAKLVVEIAETEAQLSHGLMYRRELKDGTGMLFIFEGERKRSFWMKNTFVDLDIGFFDASRKLVDVQQMKAVRSVMEVPESYESKFPAKYALEVPKGWFARAKIPKDAVFRLDGSP